MDPQRYRQVDAAFEKLLELPAGDRLRVLEERCDGDDELRQDLVELLRAAEESGDFLCDPGSLPRPAEVETDVEDVGSTTGAYRLLELLGEGGAAKVYRAEPLAGGSHVAVKLSRLGSGTAQTQRFRQEWQILVQLDHPSIARCQDYGTTRDGRLYLLMELVDGPGIDRWCDERRLSVPQRLSLFHEVCRAVGEAHRVGIVHRDLKPSNVLIGRDGAVKIADFGIALDAAGPPLTQTGHSVGTPRYMSPEQLYGERADARSDLFSLGVVLYEMCTAMAPFDGDATDEDTALVRRIEAERHPSARALAPEVPRALSRLIATCLRAKPKHRFASAAALRSELERHLGSPTWLESQAEIAHWLARQHLVEAREGDTRVAVRSEDAPPRFRLRWAAAFAVAVVAALAGWLYTGYALPDASAFAFIEAAPRPASRAPLRPEARAIAPFAADPSPPDQLARSR